MNIQQQELTSQLIDINDKNSAMINLLLGYCDNYLEKPPRECLFDLTIGLEQLKQYSNDFRNILIKYD